MIEQAKARSLASSIADISQPSQSTDHSISGAPTQSFSIDDDDFWNLDDADPSAGIQTDVAPPDWEYVRQQLPGRSSEVCSLNSSNPSVRSDDAELGMPTPIDEDST